MYEMPYVADTVQQPQRVQLTFAHPFPMPGFESLPFIVIVWIALVLAIAGMVQGAIGLGFPMLATPLITLVADMRTAVILVLLPCVASTVTNIVRSGPILQTLKQFWYMPVYMFIGALIGARLFVAYAAFPFALLLASVILLYLYLDRRGLGKWPIVARHPASFGVIFGTIAGMSEGAANIAAPPLLMYFFSLGIERNMLVQVLNICFTVGKPTQFLILTAQGGVTATQWLATLPFAVLATVTTVVGIRIRNRIDAVTYRRWLLKVLFIIALVLMVQVIAPVAWSWVRS